METGDQPRGFAKSKDVPSSVARLSQPNDNGGRNGRGGVKAGGGVSRVDHTSDIPVKQIKIAWVRHDRLLELNRRRKKDGLLDDHEMITK